MAHNVAVVNSTIFVFYIVPPHQGSDLSYVDVKYHIKTPYRDMKQKTAPSASRADICVLASFSVFHEGAIDFREEIVESTDASVRERKSSCRASDKPAGQTVDSKLSQAICEPSCEREGSGPPSGKQDNCPQKNFIQSDPSYLRTLGHSHSGWIFGAIAELIDNSRDAKASRLDISISNLYSKKEGGLIPVLSVVDDGHGMSHMDIVRMLSFGHKQPEVDDPDHIGRFGIGFKGDMIGAMKLGQDAIVLTQTSHSRSVALLSQTFNEGKNNIEIPIVSYRRLINFMEVDTRINSEATANAHLKAIKDFSPFNEYFIGEKISLFREGTGTQIYIWNLDKWGSNYCLEWTDQGCTNQTGGDILIRSRRVRSRPGQLSQQVPLDYSLQSYLEVIFIDPRMRIFVQGSRVKSRPLAKSLNQTTIETGEIMGTTVRLTLGRSQMEWERMNCGMFLYWHGRLIEAYKRVGGMVYSDMGRGLIGVIDVTDVSDGNRRVWVHSNKQGFEDCEAYAELEKWLGKKADEYWDANLDVLRVNSATGSMQLTPHRWKTIYDDDDDDNDDDDDWGLMRNKHDMGLEGQWIPDIQWKKTKINPYMLYSSNEKLIAGSAICRHLMVSVEILKSKLNMEWSQLELNVLDANPGSASTQDDEGTPRRRGLKRLQRGPKRCKKTQ
ncbi:hypothetical protein ACLOJK_021259 [Asimina triloba]